MDQDKTRVRFAPSPTGLLTLGSARTALFNWLYAKHNDGKFLLRIEDTDKERNKEKYEENILQGLKWLGLEWDEKLTRQSNRTGLYKKHLEKLIEEDKAYYCFCSKEELQKEREAQIAQGLSPTYSEKCRKLSQEEAKERLQKGESAVIRFKMPKTKIEFKDIIRGTVDFDGSKIGDFVIAKNKESPLYNFAVVIDDVDMDITHIIRGEDHISNTPKQIAIAKALNFETPKFAHLPLIMAPGGGKLSGRFAEDSILDYRNQGYLPQALFNFMTLLGWHPKEDKEVISKQEAIEKFNLKRVQKGGAAINPEKLNWYNGYYIRNSETKELFSHTKKFIPDKWLEKKDKVLKALEIEKERMKKLTDFKEKAKFFFKLPDYEAKMIAWNEQYEDSHQNLQEIYDFVKNLPEEEFDKKRIEEFLLNLSEEVGGKGEVYWPLRASLSGQKASPGALEIMWVLGKDESLRRIKKAIKRLEGADKLPI
ncbi:MAG: glutamate--tRNA ligase [Candidatus Magasanikbacteria bacterium]